MPGNKLGRTFPMVIVSTLPRAEFGRNHRRQCSPYITTIYFAIGLGFVRWEKYFFFIQKRMHQLGSSFLITCQKFDDSWKAKIRSENWEKY